MKLYFRNLGISILKELWDLFGGDILNNLPEDKEYVLHFPYTLEHYHLYKLKPWKMTLKPGWNINIGVYQCNSRYNWIRGVDGLKKVVPNRQQILKELYVVNNNRIPGNFKNMVLSISNLNSFLLSGNVLIFSETMIKEFKKMVENYARYLIKTKFMKKSNIPPTYLLMWKPERYEYYFGNGNWIDRNYKTNIRLTIRKKNGIIDAEISCWTRKEKVTKVVHKSCPKSIPLFKYNSIVL